MRSIRRLRREQGVVFEDQRPVATQPEPKNKLIETEREQILAICNDEKYANLPPPSQIVGD